MAKMDMRSSAPPENMLTTPRIVPDWSLKNSATRCGIDARHRDEGADAIDDQRPDQEQQAAANLAEAGRVAERCCRIHCGGVGH